MKINVLDNIGYVELMDMMGDDLTPVHNARVSFNASVYDDMERNWRLLDYLYANEHTSVTESIVFKFRIKLPIFVARQLMRSRLSSFSERSGRYTEYTEGEYYIPKNWRKQSVENKQGSSTDFRFEENDDLNYIYNDCIDTCIITYKKMLDMGVAKEMARMILPVSFYTEIVWTINLRSLMNFLKQRLDEHAQYEIREYAMAISSIFREKLPKNYEMFYKYILKST